MRAYNNCCVGSDNDWRVGEMAQGAASGRGGHGVSGHGRKTRERCVGLVDTCVRRRSPAGEGDHAQGCCEVGVCVAMESAAREKIYGRGRSRKGNQTLDTMQGTPHTQCER